LSEATEDLCILYRAVSRRQGRSIDYAGCVTAQEAFRLKQMGLAKIVDVHGDDQAGGSREGRLPIPGAIRVSLREAADGRARPSERKGRTSPERDDANRSMIDSLHLLAGHNDILMFLSQNSEVSHAAATMAAQAGFYCVLNVLDGREQYRRAGAAPSVARGECQG